MEAYMETNAGRVCELCQRGYYPSAHMPSLGCREVAELPRRGTCALLPTTDSTSNASAVARYLRIPLLCPFGGRRWSQRFASAVRRCRPVATSSTWRANAMTNALETLP